MLQNEKTNQLLKLMGQTIKTHPQHTATFEEFLVLRERVLAATPQLRVPMLIDLETVFGAGGGSGRVHPAAY